MSHRTHLDMSKYEKGKIVTGRVTGIKSYGIFVTIDEHRSGLVHISEISNDYVSDVGDYADLGDIIKVRIVDVNNDGSKMKLSLKNINYKKIYNKSSIVETKSGFSTLKKKLPIWIEESLKSKKIQKKWKSFRKVLTKKNYDVIVYSVSYGELAQLVRASALQAGGHRFESYIPHHAGIAQLVEQLTCNQ